MEIKARIEYVPTFDNSNISFLFFSKGASNYSAFKEAGNYSSSISTPNNGSCPFQLGISELGEGATFSNNYQGYISKDVYTNLDLFDIDNIEQGALYYIANKTFDSNKQASSSRVRSSNLIIIPNGTTSLLGTCDSGVFAIQQFDVYKRAIRDSGWITNGEKSVDMLENAVYVALVFRNANDSAIVPSDVADFNFKLTPVGDNSDLTITLQGANIGFITINFNDVSDEYATNITINDVDYENYNTSFYTNLTKTDTVVVKLNSWNKTNESYKISSIELGMVVDYTKSNGLKSFVRGSQIIDDNSSYPVYGVIGSYGDLELYDKNNIIQSLADSGYLRGSKSVKLYLEDTLIGTYLSEKFSKKNENSIDVSLISSVINMDSVYVEKKVLGKNLTLRDLFDYLQLVAIDNGFYFNTNVNYVVATYKMYNIKVPYLYINGGTLTEQFNKVCDIAQARIYVNNKDNMELILYE